MAKIEETSGEISVSIQCVKESESRAVLREYLGNAQKLYDLFEELPLTIKVDESILPGNTKVALAYRIIVEHHLDQAWRGITVANGILKGEIDPKDTRFSDLLDPDHE